MSLEPGNRPVTNMVNAAASNPKRKLRIGYVVFSLLVVVKIIEYVVANTVSAGNWPFLGVLALISAWLIVYYYKHINQLWHPGEADE